MSSTVRKAVIPAAGLGTRFLPATKSQPKEMLPLVDKPAIQYVVEEAVRAGMDDLLVITSRNKSTIEDHFDRSLELEAALAASGKDEMLAMVRSIAELAQVHYVRQGQAAGLGHAVGCARRHAGGESFAVLLPDDVMHPSSTLLSRMSEVASETGGAVIALMEVPESQISAYGCAGVVERQGHVARIAEIVEKPDPGEAPSNLAVMGRYVFPADVFEAIDATEPGKNGEIQLTDAIAKLAAQGRAHGVIFSGGRYDTGNKADYLRATVELALEHPELGTDFGAYLAELVAEHPDLGG